MKMFQQNDQYSADYYLYGRKTCHDVVNFCTQDNPNPRLIKGP